MMLVFRIFPTGLKFIYDYTKYFIHVYRRDPSKAMEELFTGIAVTAGFLLLLYVMLRVLYR
jgi:hypothetical protein